MGVILQDYCIKWECGLFGSSKDCMIGKQTSQIIWRKIMGEWMDEKVSGLLIKRLGNMVKLGVFMQGN